jgi:hypothetical protein
MRIILYPEGEYLGTKCSISPVTWNYEKGQKEYRLDGHVVELENADDTWAEIFLTTQQMTLLADICARWKTNPTYEGTYAFGAAIYNDGTRSDQEE